MPADKESNGLVIRQRSGVYTVRFDDDGRRYDCSVRGRMLEQASESDLVAIGDRVRFDIADEAEGLGVIKSVAPRWSALSRALRTEGPRGAGMPEREQVLVANADVVLYVFAIAQPKPSLRMLDRFLVAGERARIAQLVIVINKIDLLGSATPPTNSDFTYYERLGYPLVWTSAVTGAGLANLRTYLDEGIAVVSGPSGVGKSSLLNAIQPGVARRVRSLDKGRGEGMHTTRDRELVLLASGAYLADTPGLRTLNFWDLEPDELDGYFRDIAPLVPDCRFRNCSHHQEPGCAVRAAVDASVISRSRYRSYCSFHAELVASYEI